MIQLENIYTNILFIFEHFVWKICIVNVKDENPGFIFSSTSQVISTEAFSTSHMLL